jgi:DASH complex subunit DAD2
MAYRPTAAGLPSHIRPSSGLATSTNPNLTGSSNTQSSALQARITEKRAELESLKQLRDLSGGLAGQMQQLEEKLSTLSNGTQAVAEVLSNWNGVLRAVYMASGMHTRILSTI